MILAAGSWDNTISLWDMRDAAQPALLGSPLQGHTNWVRSIAFHPNGQLLASGGADNRVILWDIQNPANPSPLASSLEGHATVVGTNQFYSGM
jgi:WD40 repeat protein